MRDVLESAISARAFPGATLRFERAQTVREAACGRLTYAPDAQPVTPGTLYDLASLSKLFTLSAFLLAAREVGIEVDAPLFRFLPVFDTSDKRAITLRMLMQHNSGIEFAIQRLHETSVEAWLPRVAEARLHAPPGEKVLYSCTNFWLLARVVETLAATTLDALIATRIVQPLKMSRTTFAPLDLFAPHEIAPTEVHNGQAWCGVVHDEAARTWQAQTRTGAGNAGLFGTARDVALFARMWLNEGENVLHPDDVQSALRDLTPEGACQRAWGWQYENLTFMPRRAYGHSGFTGPTLWISPETRTLGVILNNRVHPTRNGPHRMPYHRQLNEAFLLA